MNLIIRKAIKDDIEAIRTIQYQSWLDTYPNDELWITREDIEFRFAQRSRQEAVEFMQKRLFDKNHTFLIWQEDKKIVWYLEITDEWESAKIGALYILTGMRGKWIWKALMEKGLDLLKSKKYITLEVAEYNEWAIRFYERFGFAIGKEVTREIKMSLSWKSIYCKEMRKVINN